MRSMSASGPLGPTFFGVWQSWQPPPMINILPRSTCDTAGAPAGTSLVEGAWTGGAVLHPAIATATGISKRTATRDQHKRMSLHSSAKRVTSAVFKRGRKYTPIVRLRPSGSGALACGSTNRVDKIRGRAPPDLLHRSQGHRSPIRLHQPVLPAGWVLARPSHSLAARV